MSQNRRETPYNRPEGGVGSRPPTRFFPARRHTWVNCVIHEIGMFLLSSESRLNLRENYVVAWTKKWLWRLPEIAAFAYRLVPSRVRPEGRVFARSRSLTLLRVTPLDQLAFRQRSRPCSCFPLERDGPSVVKGDLVTPCLCCVGVGGW